MGQSFLYIKGGFRPELVQTGLVHFTKAEGLSFYFRQSYFYTYIKAGSR